jgi:hypothetical protein
MRLTLEIRNIRNVKYYNRNTLRILIHRIYAKLLIISELSNSNKKFFILSLNF